MTLFEPILSTVYLGEAASKLPHMGGPPISPQGESSEDANISSIGGLQRNEGRFGCVFEAEHLSNPFSREIQHPKRLTVQERSARLHELHADDPGV